ncbi:MAG: hypothetical protein JSW66_19895 [Phycisphaerales bacterium]|nr:MAG: hypothetical protein JSW66_19895 [Phycisphaerales bacterium]
MRTGKWLIAAAAMAAFMGAETVKAQDEATVGATADFLGKYLWRGQNLVDDRVLQSGAGIGYKGLTASAWGNLDLTGENGNRGEFSEVDLTLDYSWQCSRLDVLSYSVGLIYYDFPVPKAGDDTTELYWGLSLDVPAGPSVTVYHDIDEAEGAYVSLGIGHSFAEVLELGPRIPVSLDLGATLGWGSASYNKFYWGSDNGKFNDLVLSLALPFEIGGLTVTPSVNYVTLVSDDIRRTDAYGRDSDDLWYAGVGFAKEF